MNFVETPGYGSDPLQEHDATRAPGLLQKYAGRALLITTQACAIHCRYCFRREFPYSEQQEAAEEGASRFSAALDVIASDTSIEEVILSGGDPLSLERCAPDAHHRRDCRHAACAAHPRAHAPAHRAAVARGWRAC